jgi:selenocysteine lyase/cysteine desulfurase
VQISNLKDEGNMENQLNYRDLYVGLDIEVPMLDGNSKVYINFDNAASTPAFQSVQDQVNKFLNFYSSVHRGTGFKSQISTAAYEQARAIILNFVGADPATHVCIFGKNTSEAINKLARRFPFTKGRDIVLTSGMEHHSNDLPWRFSARTIHVGLLPDGRLDEEDFDRKLEKYHGNLALVAISGASNVTGVINPIYRLAEKTHAVGAQIAVDCAQLAPHRAVDMRPLDDPGHLDYVAISAHKMYAPYGTGALIGRKDTFNQGKPDYSGGGTVEIVTLEEVAWADAPDRDEAGSPNTVGAIALAAAIQQLNKVTMETVAEHEAQLTEYALKALAKLPGISVYGDKNPDTVRERLGVIPFNLEGKSHFLVASILGHEFGIGVRSGCFCAHPYVLHLLNLSHEEAKVAQQKILAGAKGDMPGLLRGSFGLYNSTDEIDQLMESLTRIIEDDYQGEYWQDQASGEYLPSGWEPHFSDYFSLV